MNAPNAPNRLAGVSAILVRELRARMRGKRAFIFLTVYLAVLSWFLWMGIRTSESDQLAVNESLSIGRGIFGSIILIETIVVLVLGTAYTAGTISQEREKQTFDMLAATPISSLAIVIGKLASGLAYLAVVVGASIPLASLGFVFGGYEPLDVLIAYLILAVTAVGVGAIGVCCSAIMKRTQPATVAAFIVVMLVAAGPSVVVLFQGNPNPPRVLLYTNPFMAESDLLCGATGTFCLPIVARPRADGLELGGGRAPGLVDMRPQLVTGDFWPRSVVAWAVLAAVVIAVAAQAVSPTRRWRAAAAARSHGGLPEAPPPPAVNDV